MLESLISIHVAKKVTKRVINLILPFNSEKGLAFDIDQFQKIKIEAQNTKVELLTLKGNVIGSVDALREGWKTEAGKVFFENLDANWLSAVDKYADTLDVFIDVLDQVIDCFQNVETELNALAL